MSVVGEKIKFNIVCRKLLTGLKKVSGVIENAQVMQILSCVKIKMPLLYDFSQKWTSYLSNLHRFGKQVIK